MLKRASKRQKIETFRSHSDKKRKSKHQSTEQYILGGESGPTEDEKRLEKVVLGGGDDILDKLQPQPQPEEDGEPTEEKPKPVWNDDDDDSFKVKISSKDFKHKYFKHQDKKVISSQAYTDTLKSQFERVTGKPTWAKLKWEKTDKGKRDDGDTDDDDDNDDPQSRKLLQATGQYLDSSESLPQGLIQIKSCTDVNKEAPADCKLKAMEFHPSAQVMLAGGSGKTLTLFQVDGKTNPKIQSIFLDKFPILSAHFTKQGTEVVMGSVHKGFKYYDMLSGQVVNVPRIKGIEDKKMGFFEMSPDGKYVVFMGDHGNMHFLSASSKEWLYTLKMNGTVESITFSPDSSKMFSHGDDGEVYIWDLKARDCVHRFTDDGCIKGTKVAVSRNGQFIATGCYSGIVNLYDESCLSERLPKPLKVIKNLTTPCTNMVFNSTSEILAIASNYADKAVRLIHTASRTAFSNFPDRVNSDLRFPTILDFSVNSGYFAIGNNQGKALLYRVKHYSNY